uniref:ATP synthase F0 subunit 6 n=1 Tax=Facelina bostoniensis TaxID=219665 RepID=UPI002579F102|nr:ATP synthase F0 subunit 6 [Facelina bostoniensis]WGV42886.1 ATP synthase F0 subunit 6 [Facelina bostoniensis]
MFTDLFSALDCMQIGWLSTLLWTIPAAVASIFIISNSWGQSNQKIFLALLSTNSETRQKSLPGIPLLVFSLMGFILFSNLLGLVPFVYGITSNIWVVGSLALVFWGLLILSGWTKFPTESAAHLAPAGAPAALVPLLVMIETVSICIRPLTLMVRLIANISAGHIIMGLIANALAVSALHIGAMTFFVHVGYNIFEVFVCFIQAYIFSLLVKLYSEEHPGY